MIHFLKFLLDKIPTPMSSITSNRQLFKHRRQYLIFTIFQSLLLFKSLIVTTVDVYKFHALTRNKNKEKTLKWSYNVIASQLQCDSFKLLKKVLLTFLGKMNSKKNKLYGPFLWMGFNCLKARATSRRWQMAFKQRQETTTQNMLKQLIYHVYSFNTFSLSEEIKDKCIAIIQKQIITKIIIR